MKIREIAALRENEKNPRTPGNLFRRVDVKKKKI